MVRMLMSQNPPQQIGRRYKGKKWKKLLVLVIDKNVVVNIKVVCLFI